MKHKMANRVYFRVKWSLSSLQTAKTCSSDEIKKECFKVNHVIFEKREKKKNGKKKRKKRKEKGKERKK